MDSDDITSGWPQYRAECAMTKSLTKENEMLLEKVARAEAKTEAVKKLLSKSLDLLYVMSVHDEHARKCVVCDAVARINEDLRLIGSE